jgi:hypothetical protein
LRNCVIQNKTTKAKHVVGNDCVKKFMGHDFTKTFDKLRKEAEAKKDNGVLLTYIIRVGKYYKIDKTTNLGFVISRFKKYSPSHCVEVKLEGDVLEKVEKLFKRVKVDGWYELPTNWRNHLESLNVNEVGKPKKVPKAKSKTYDIPVTKKYDFSTFTEAPKYKSNNTSSKWEKQTIKPSTILAFGKYRGQMVKDVHRVDKGYISWLCDNYDGNIDLDAMSKLR